MGYFGNLKLDKWFKAVTYIGGIMVVLSITIPVRVVSNEFVAAVGFGMFLYGVGRWKNHKTRTKFILGGKLSWPERNPDAIGLLLEISGLMLVLGAVGYLTQSLI